MYQRYDDVLAIKKSKAHERRAVVIRAVVLCVSSIPYYFSFSRLAHIHKRSLFSLLLIPFSLTLWRHLFIRSVCCYCFCCCFYLVYMLSRKCSRFWTLHRGRFHGHTIVKCIVHTYVYVFRVLYSVSLTKHVCISIQIGRWSGLQILEMDVQEHIILDLPPDRNHALVQQYWPITTHITLLQTFVFTAFLCILYFLLNNWYSSGSGRNKRIVQRVPIILSHMITYREAHIEKSRQHLSWLTLPAIQIRMRNAYCAFKHPCK